MKKNIRVCALFFVIINVMWVSACAMNGNYDNNGIKVEEETEMTKRIVLNERQIGILEEAELPTDYYELNQSQKSAILCIEEMLVYLEDKYGETFCYDGYVPDGGVDPEYLTAYAEKDSKKRIVTLYRKYENGEYVYEDDYQNILAEEDYKNALMSFISKYIDEKDYKLFVEIDDVDDNWTKESIINDVYSSDVVFLKNEINTDIMEFLKMYGEWMKNQINKELSATTIFIIQSKEAFEETNEYNYEEQIYSQNYMKYIFCSVDNGKVDIKEWE